MTWARSIRETSYDQLDMFRLVLKGKNLNEG